MNTATLAAVRLSSLALTEERIARIAAMAAEARNPAAYIDRAAKNRKLDLARNAAAMQRLAEKRREDAQIVQTIESAKLAEAARMNLLADEAERIALTLTGIAARNVRLATAVMLRGVGYERVMAAHGIKRDAAYQGVHRGMATLAEFGSRELAEFVASTRKRGPR